MDFIKKGKRNLIYSAGPVDNVYTIIINDRTPLKIKLSEVLKHVPNGIVIKDETGMGATTLEITARRPSIIVEPLKITASSKATEHDAIYYGSKTARESRPSPKELIERLHSKTLNQRKIIVVADSLPKIKEILKDEFKDYFLMIDEIDSFQLDSTFRMSMAKCLDIYKEHPTDKRALVTATPLAFSDAELQGENKVLIKYHTSQVRDINLEHCDEVKGRALEIITALLEMHPDEKIMVAYNSVDGCVEIARHLVSFEAQLKEDIKILCSVTTDSKNKAGDFFHELTTDVLPGRINLVTSAYFTGFDLHDSYHLVIISDSKNPIFLLSDKRIKQISGRCRHRLLSETVVFTTTPIEREFPTKEEMLQAAEIEKKALNCISSNYEDTPLLKTSISKVREYIIEHTSDNGAQFLRTNIYDEVVINFLSIDASTEAHQVKKFLYDDRDQLLNALLKEGHRVKFNSQPAAIKVSKVKIEDAEAELQISEIIERVINSSIAELNDELHDNHYLSYAEKDIIEAYLDHSPYLEQGM